MKKLALAMTVALAAMPAFALYKVVGPDGKVTYTDRPPTDASAKIVPYGSAAQADPAAAAYVLPADLREVVARYPVVLYTSPECPPCDSARALLRERGIPYTEKRVASDEDILAYERLVGSRTVPGATIGAQQLRGLNVGDWTAYLDAAGYPKESRLPRGWQPPPVTPVAAAREPAAAPAPAPRPQVPPPAPAPDAPPAPGSIRF